MSLRTRVLIVDDHPVVISGVRRLLSLAPDFEVVAHAMTAEAAIEAATGTTPDLVLLDLRLPEVHSADLCRALTTTLSRAKVVIFTAFVDSTLLRACLLAGAAGVLLKDADETNLVADLRHIRAGRTVIDPRLKGVPASLTRVTPGNDLTPRELEVLRLLAEGMSSKEMAAALGISPNTVRSYCQSVLFKLQATSRLQALANARARELL